jgi:hypothetical protein
MFTEKAYPEDETVWTTGATLEGPLTVANELIYERRFGARNQLEFVFPFQVARSGENRWRGGFGDLAVAVKRALYHSLSNGTILSLAGEVILPTGDAEDGFGSGILRFEPFLAIGKMLPADGFVQAQSGVEFASDRSRAIPEAFGRVAVGRSFVEGRFGRSWSPMLEILAARELAASASTELDLAPQFQVTLSRRQHVMASVAARVPVTDSDDRPIEILIYLLHDWFDGGFFQGW